MDDPSLPHVFAHLISRAALLGGVWIFEALGFLYDTGFGRGAVFEALVYAGHAEAVVGGGLGLAGGQEGQQQNEREDQMKQGTILFHRL
jgi:hypothetical protein